MESKELQRKRQGQRLRTTLSSLPNELLHEIARGLSLYDILALAHTSRALRKAVKSPLFGKQFLEQDAESVRVEVSQPLVVGGLDGFEYGVADNPAEFATNDKRLAPVTYFVHHRTPDTSTLHLYVIFPSGYVKTVHRSLGPPRECTSSPITTDGSGSSTSALLVGPEHRKLCPLCSNVAAQKILHWVDKRYRVFFLTWEDQCEVQEPGKATMDIKVVHQENGMAGWNAIELHANGHIWQVDYAPLISVYRYGLRQSQQKSLYIEQFFGLRAHASAQRNDSEDARENRILKTSSKIFNPWA
ncbi:hypothetical protein BC832DRAFT_246629 [Gaertneriomyces semiglobifer]|nr:hypothetical protein BC832DRAFT_246629 [Gaertneriomyces semiglobifer]